MATVFKKNFFSGDLVRGAEQGTVMLIGRLNLGSSYATGGPAVDFADIHPDCANASLIYFGFAPSQDMANYVLWDSANSKLPCYVRSTDAEVSNATDLSATAKEHRCLIIFRVSTAVSESTTID